MARYVTRTEFADLCGVTKQTIHDNIKNNRSLSQTMTRGGKIDLQHAEAIKYMESKDVDPATATMSEFSELTIGEIMLKCPEGFTKIKDVSTIAKLKADVDLKRLMVKEKTNELISRKEVAQVCFGLIDTLFKRVLEMPKDISSIIIQKVLSDGENAKVEIESIISKAASQYIQNTKKEVADKLEDVEDKSDE